MRCPFSVEKREASLKCTNATTISAITSYFTICCSLGPRSVHAEQAQHEPIVAKTSWRACFDHFGAFCEHFGAFWEHFGPFLEHFGPFWSILGALWTGFGAFWSVFGAFWSVFGAFLEHFGSFSNIPTILLWTVHSNSFSTTIPHSLSSKL